jgi:hypothetical protein
MIKKSKWLVLTVAIMLVFGLSTGAAGAKEAAGNADGLKVKHIAAPAVANQLLKESGLKNHYGTESEKGNYISEVARYMGEGTDFDGISKDDAGAYKFAIATFLNNGVVPANIPLYDLVETITVDSAVYTGESSAVLEAGVQYQFVVSGTWENDDQGVVDAVYVSEDNWETYSVGPTGYNEKLLDLQVDSEFMDWGGYSAAHEYQCIFTGTGAVVNFRVFEGDIVTDGDITTYTLNQSWYDDNIGELTVEIYKAKW